MRDQAALFIRAVPSIAVAIGFNPMGLKAIDWFHVTVPVSVVGARDKASGLDLFINTLLERFVETCAFGSHVTHIGELRLARDRELMTRIAWETQALRVVGNNFDHCVFFLLVFASDSSPKSKKPDP